MNIVFTSETYAALAAAFSTKNTTNKAGMLTWVAAVTLCVMISGCAGTVLRPVSEADRDTTGKYNGWWNAKTVDTVSSQRFGNWRSNCSDPGLDFSFQVADSQINMNSNDVTRSAYIDKDGRFRITFPTGQKTRESASSTRLLSSDTVLVLEGVLGDEPPVGRYTIEIVQLGNGCKSTVAYTKLAGRP